MEGGSCVMSLNKAHESKYYSVANDENKEALYRWIDAIQDGGSTNYRDSLKLAFKTVADIWDHGRYFV